MHLEMPVLASALTEPYSHFAVRPGRDGKHRLQKAEEDKSAHKRISAPDGRGVVRVGVFAGVGAYSFGAVEHSWLSRWSGRSLNKRKKQRNNRSLGHAPVLRQNQKTTADRRASGVPSLSFRSHQAWSTLRGKHTSVAGFDLLR